MSTRIKRLSFEMLYCRAKSKNAEYRKKATKKAELNPGEGVWREVKAHRLGRAGVFTFADMKSKALGALRHLAHRPDKIRKLFRTPSTRYAA